MLRERSLWYATTTCSLPALTSLVQRRCWLLPKHVCDGGMWTPKPSEASEMFLDRTLRGDLRWSFNASVIYKTRSNVVHGRAGGARQRPLLPGRCFSLEKSCLVSVWFQSRVKVWGADSKRCGRKWFTEHSRISICSLVISRAGQYRAGYQLRARKWFQSSLVDAPASYGVCDALPLSPEISFRCLPIIAAKSLVCIGFPDRRHSIRLTRTTSPQCRSSSCIHCRCVR